MKSMLSPLADRVVPRVRESLPVLFDAAAFVVITVGVAKLFGDWAWLTAGLLLVLAGLRASE